MAQSGYPQVKLRIPSARLLLLTKFLRPGAVKELAGLDDWKQVLRQSVESAVDRLVRDGLLVEGTLSDRLSYSLKVGELKEILRGQKLPVSGKKEELITRLVGNCADSVQELVRHTSVVVCSPEGRKLAEAYLGEQQQWALEVQNTTRQQLSERRFAQASETMARFEAKQVFPSGINVDWSNYDVSADVSILRKLFEHVPAFLGALQGDELEQVRLAAGLYYLWGTPSEPFPLGQSVTHRIPKEQLAQMLWYAAKFQVELAELKEMGVFRWVGIEGCNDDLVCPACRELQQKRHPIDGVPELPYVNCTSVTGCRCGMVPISDRE